MKVKALKNLIYDGSFYKVGEVLTMKDTDVTNFETLKLVIRLLQGSKPETKSNVPNSLPPLTLDGKKKK